MRTNVEVKRYRSAAVKYLPASGKRGSRTKVTIEKIRTDTLPYDSECNSSAEQGLLWLLNEGYIIKGCVIVGDDTVFLLDWGESREVISYPCSDCGQILHEIANGNLCENCQKRAEMAYAERLPDND